MEPLYLAFLFLYKCQVIILCLYFHDSPTLYTHANFLLAVNKFKQSRNLASFLGFLAKKQVGKPGNKATRNLPSYPGIPVRGKPGTRLSGNYKRSSSVANFAD